MQLALAIGCAPSALQPSTDLWCSHNLCQADNLKYVCALFFPIRLIYCKAEWKGEGEKRNQSSICCLFPRWLQWLWLGQVKASNQNYTLVSHWGVRGPGSWFIFCCLPGILAGCWVTNRVAGTQTSAPDHCLNPLCHMPTTSTCCFFKSVLASCWLLSHCRGQTQSH